MPIYRVTIEGRRKPVLVKEDSAAKAKDRFVKAESLSAEEMADAMAAGETVWLAGTPLPADDPESPPAPPKADEDQSGKTDQPKGTPAKG